MAIQKTAPKKVEAAKKPVAKAAPAKAPVKVAAKPVAKVVAKPAAKTVAAPVKAPVKVAAPVKAPVKAVAPAPVKAPAKAPVKEVSKEVSFSVYSPDSKAVGIAGEFNNWDATKGKMKKDLEGNWVLTATLAKGSYQYKVVFDGTIWELDQKAPSIMAEHGPNSIVNVD